MIDSSKIIEILYTKTSLITFRYLNNSNNIVEIDKNKVLIQNVIYKNKINN